MKRQQVLKARAQDAAHRSAKYLHMKETIFSKRQITDLVGEEADAIMNFMTREEAQSLPIDFVKGLSPSGIDAAPKGFLKDLSTRARDVFKEEGEDQARVIELVSNAKRKEVRGENLKSFLRDTEISGSVKLGLLCGSKYCPLRNAASKRGRGTVMDVMFKRNESAAVKLSKLLALRARLNSSTFASAEVVVEFLEDVDQKWSDTPTSGHFMRLLTEMLGQEEVLEAENLIADENGDAYDLNELEGVRLQTDTELNQEQNQTLLNEIGGKWESFTVMEMDFSEHETSEGANFGEQFCGAGTVFNTELSVCVASFDGALTACEEGRGEWSFTCQPLTNKCSDKDDKNNTFDSSSFRRRMQRASQSRTTGRRTVSSYGHRITKATKRSQSFAKRRQNAARGTKKWEQRVHKKSGMQRYEGWFRHFFKDVASHRRRMQQGQNTKMSRKKDTSPPSWRR